MNNQTKLSVVMPVYNAEKYLKQSIESILNQTYKEFEFIIIDDGSTDNSLNILKKYAEVDERIKIITRENKGLVHTLNEGIRKSEGKYVARMDADDICNPKRFEKEMEFLIENEEYGVVASFVSIFGNAYSSEENLKLEVKHNNENFELLDLLCGISYICHPSVIVKKELFDLYGYYKAEYKYSEDLELWTRFMINGVKIKNLPCKLINYRKDVGSKTNVEQKLIVNDMIRMRLEAVNKINSLDGKDFSYLIWGASSGGENCLAKCREVFNQGKFLGYIDSFKNDSSGQAKIYKPQDINNLSFDYVFIATSPGKFYATIYLSKFGKNILKDFINVID